MSFRLFNHTASVVATKESSRALPGPYTTQSRLQTFHDDQLSNSDTPSLTTGTRSGSSSIKSCEACENSSQQCSCSIPSDFESLRLHHTPYASPPGFVRLEKEFVSSRDLDDQHCHNTEFAETSKRYQGSYPFPRVRTDPFHDTATADNNLLSGDTSTSDSHPCSIDRALNSGKTFETGNTNSTAADSESEKSDDGEYEDEDDGYFDKGNQWSGQDDNLEAIVLEALQGDLVLAAQMIPIWHKMYYIKFQTAIKQKVGPWQNGIMKYSGATEAGDGGPSNNEGSNRSNPRKRQRRPGSTNRDDRQDDDENNDDENDDDNGDSKNRGDDGNSRSPAQNPRLACPFHKRNPSKYSIQYNGGETAKRIFYRSCEGPGFDSIQRLKEHLRRKHSPVQCDRCYTLFPGTDKELCILQLESHRQLDIPCQRGDPSLKEGVSEAQWASLEKRNNVKRPAEVSRVETYWIIWDTIFPGVPRPPYPWHEDKSTVRAQFSLETQTFSQSFAQMLDIKLNQQDIVLQAGVEEVMRGRIISLAEKAFSVFAGLHWPSSSANSSSGRSVPHSSTLGGSSYEMVSNPRSYLNRHASSSSRSTGAQTQMFSIDVQSSPSRRTSMPPPFMNMPQMAQQDYASNTINNAIVPVSAGYSVSFPENSFSGNGLAVNGSDWYNGFSNGEPSYASAGQAGNISAVDFAGMARSGMGQPLTDGSESEGQNLNSLPDWQHLANSRQLGYNGSQQ